MRSLLAVAGVVLVLAVLLIVGFPGSRAVLGRYPIWELNAVADKVNEGNANSPNPCGVGADPSAQINLVTSRIEASRVAADLTPYERGMLAEGFTDDQAIRDYLC